MAEIKDRRFINEAIEVMNTLDDVQKSDPVEKLIEVLDLISGDEAGFAKALATALTHKGFDKERFESFMNSVATEFGEGTETTEVGDESDDESDIFFDPSKQDQTEIDDNLSPRKNTIGNNTRALKGYDGQYGGRDENLDKYKPTNKTRVKYEDL